MGINSDGKEGGSDGKEGGKDGGDDSSNGFLEDFRLLPDHEESSQQDVFVFE